MAKRIAQSTLNASTVDILNVIRQNASYDYQRSVPNITKATDIPKVGEIIYGTPSFANQFLNALINRIALVAIQSAVFNNPYSALKKGYLEFGETVEDIFIQIANVIDYSAEKAPAREFKRTVPDVRSVFHTMNWRVMYPVTVNDEDLRLALLSADGVANFITELINSVYPAAEYDEFLLFKYLLIKAISKGKMYPVSIGDGTDLRQSAVQYRGISNMLTFMSKDYNESGVKTVTPKDRQVIFMDSMYNAQFDVEVLASAFNMSKAEFMGRLYLIDNWTTFDNERFETIRANSDGIEEVTAEELALLQGVKGVLIDSNWFQVYDNNNKFTDKYVASGLYWNYFYHTWKTVSYSPFANAVVFALSNVPTALPETLTVEITGKSISEEATVFTLEAQNDSASLVPSSVQYVQTEPLTQSGIAVQKYGALIIPSSQTATEITLVATVGNTTYTGATTINAASEVGATVTLNKG